MTMEFLDGGQFAVSVEIGGALLIVDRRELDDGLKDLKNSLVKIIGQKFVA